MQEPAAPLLELVGITKTFPNGTIALRGVVFTAYAGRVHGLLGANGAGKSTLIKILSATYGASGGRMLWKGSQISFDSPLAANRAGIATIHQNIPLVATLSVIENVFLWKTGFRRRNPQDRKHFHALCEETGYPIDPDVEVGELSIGSRQMVCILQALSHGADLIVMDEPTASLAREERDIVYSTVRRLSSQGKGIIFVSHFLDEIVALTDELTVLRDGLVVMQAITADVNEAAIAEAIAGKVVDAMEQLRSDRGTVRESVVLSCQSLASPAGLASTNLEVHAGEVVGIAGLLGSGRSELIHAIFGSDPAATGKVRFEGKLMPRNPRRSVKEGIALVPEDRDQQAIVPVFELWKNVSLPYLDRSALAGAILQPGVELTEAQAAIERLNIKTESPHTLVTELSGGNAQKVVVARWVFSDIKLLLLDEPTAGIDVGAKADILILVRELAKRGVAIVIVSSEFEELLAVSDRILVMRDGEIVATREANQADVQELILLASAEIDTSKTIKMNAVENQRDAG